MLPEEASVIASLYQTTLPHYKQLSFWASRNVGIARWLVILFYAAVNALGMLWAAIALQHSWHPGPAFPLLPCTLTLVALAFYFKKKRPGRPDYLRKKLCNAGFGLATLLFVISSTAEVLEPTTPATPAYASILLRHTRPAAGADGQESSIARLLHRFGSAYGEMGTGKKVLLISIAVLVTLISIAGWSIVCLCLLCNGAAEALVYTLMFLGSGLLAFICIRIIQSIARGEPTNRRERIKAGGTRIFRFKPHHAAGKM